MKYNKKIKNIQEQSAKFLRDEVDRNFSAKETWDKRRLAIKLRSLIEGWEDLYHSSFNLCSCKLK